MAYTTEKISGNQVRFDFTVPAEAFDAAMQKAYLQQRGRISVPGFRKGKAPRKLIESMYGEAVFYDAAFDIIFPDLYTAAIEESKTNVVDQPSVDVKEIGAGKELVFSATVFVSPDIELGNYKGLKANRYVALVTDENIQTRIDEDMRKVTTSQDVIDRAAQTGDTVTIDYSGSVDGVKFDGGTAEKQQLKLGSGSFIPGFEEQVAGMSIGDEKDITVTFPKEYHAENLAGKEAVFHIVLHGIQCEVKPEMDDDFVQDVSEYQTVAEYKAGIEKELSGINEKNADLAVENALLQQAVDAADCDIPSPMIEREIDMQVRNMQLRMSYQGLRFEDYLKYTGMTKESIRDMMRADATNNVKTQLVIDAIAKAEKIEATDEDAEQEVARRAEEIGRDVKEYRATLNENQMENYKDIAVIRKVIDLIKSSADITTTDKPEEKVDAGEVLEKTVEAVAAAESEKAE